MKISVKYSAKCKQNVHVLLKTPLLVVGLIAGVGLLAAAAGQTTAPVQVEPARAPGSQIPAVIYPEGRTIKVMLSTDVIVPVHTLCEKPVLAMVMLRYRAQDCHARHTVVMSI